MPAAGHYTGSTDQGEPISFDVAGDSSTVTNVVVVFTVPPVGRVAVLTITRRLPVDARGRWEAAVRGTGFHGRLSGQIGPNGTGTGSLHLGGTDSIVWQTRRVTAVLPRTF